MTEFWSLPFKNEVTVSTEHIQTAQGAPPAGPQLSTRQVTGIIAALALAAFMMILNETVLTVALPGIMNDLQISAATGQWLTTGFLLTLSVVIPTTGFLLQRFNHRSLFMFAIISFIIGTAVAALAPSFVLLLAARMVQALGTAIVLPLLMTTTLRLVPAQRRGTVMGLNSVVIGVGPAVGPTVSGAVVHAWGWHYIFAMMLPIAVLVLVLGAVFFKVPASAQKTRVDAASVLLSAVAFGLLVYGISSIEHASQNPAMAIASFAIGALSLVLFIRRQRGLAREGRELLNLAPFASRNFRLAMILIMIAFGTLLGSLMVVPILLESGRGLDSLTIGLMLLPGGLAQAVASPVFGRVYDRFGPRPVLIPGTAMLALGQWLYVGVRADSPLWLFATAHVVFSIGFALLMTGLMSSAMASVDPRLFGHGSAIFNTGQQLGGAIGTTLFVTVLTLLSTAQEASGTSAVQALFDGAHMAFLIGAVLASATVVLSLFIGRGTAPTGR